MAFKLRTERQVGTSQVGRRKGNLGKVNRKGRGSEAKGNIVCSGSFKRLSPIEAQSVRVEQ